MTTLLERAFAEAAKRPVVEQELLASRLLAELTAEDDFDRAITASTDKLARLAAEALTERLFAAGFVVMRKPEGRPHST